MTGLQWDDCRSFLLGAARCALTLALLVIVCLALEVGLVSLMRWLP